MMEIMDVTDANLESCNAFLGRHEDSAQFLINNLREHGPKITAHPNSGNFKLVLSGKNIVGVFCVTCRHNVIAQTETSLSDSARTSVAMSIFEAANAESPELKGFIGDWNSIEPIATAYRSLHPEDRPTYESKEILYSYALVAADPQPRHHPQVRCLEERDFAQWLTFRNDYIRELNLPDDATDAEKKVDFLRRVQQKIWWGLFDDPKLLSQVALNSKGEGVGQVGGVFTPVSERQKGYAKATMLHMLKDCRDQLHHRKSILFTGETDIAAQKLYESMGYRRIGAFALILT